MASNESTIERQRVDDGERYWPVDPHFAPASGRWQRFVDWWQDWKARRAERAEERS